MHQKNFLKFCLVITCFQTSSFAERQNFVFIVIDDLRPALGAYSDQFAVTPNIDQLASTSFVFRNAFAQQALCAPSRNSFLTSRRPDTLHLYDFNSYWREFVGNFTTLPQYFKERGYKTFSVGKVFHPGSSSNFTDDYPLSWSEPPYHPSSLFYENKKICPNRDGTLSRNLICPVVIQAQPENTLPDLQSANAAINFLRANKNAEKPYFLAVGFHKPHIPFRFPIEYLTQHPDVKFNSTIKLQKPSTLPPVAWSSWLDVKRRDDIAKLKISFPFGTAPLQLIKSIKQNYYSSVSYIDDLIGQLLIEIDSSANVILLGDHGWSLGEHGEFAKFSNYDVALQVPLIMRLPKIRKNHKTINHIIELVDIFPTLVELLGSKMPSCVGEKKTFCTEGESLLPLMKNELSHFKDVAFSQYPRPGIFPTLHPNSDEPILYQINVMGYSIRTPQYRYTEWVQFDSENFKPNWDHIYARELYDHRIDPDENLNLESRQALWSVLNVLKEMLHIGFNK